LPCESQIWLGNGGVLQQAPLEQARALWGRKTKSRRLTTDTIINKEVLLFI